MEALLVAAILLSSIDTGQTLSGIRCGYAEANPIMRPLVGQPVAFVAVKAGVTAGLTTWLWRHRTRRGAKWVAWTWVAIEAAIVAVNVRTLRR